MGCNHPLHAFKTGRLTENGKEEFLIASGSLDLLPYSSATKFTNEPFLNVPTKVIGHRRFLFDPLDIPCGHCVGCRMSHAKEWAVRCCLEKTYYNDEECLFLTLTYDNKHLPQDRSLCKRDLQLFWKRLRRAGYEFRYFACGEYGERYHRPHYHAIVFGLNLADLEYFSMSGNLSQLFRSKTLDELWPHGLIVAGYADNASMAYTAGYVEKKQNDPLWNSYKVKPFVVMSRKPAIGTRYFLEHGESIISSNKVYGDFGLSHSHSVPRHFIRKLSDADEIWAAGRSLVMKMRAERARDVEHAVYGCSDDNYLGFLKDELALMKLNEIERS